MTNRKRTLKLYLIAVLLLIAVLIGYRVYLLVYETDYQALNADHIDRIEAALEGRDSYKFAVVGNIRNSMRIFEQRISPLIKSNDIDFMISAGNAVYDGAESKYRLLHRSLEKMDIPYILASGHNEVEDFGAERFYQHFGPYFFSFHLKNAYFVFLDSTGQTSWKWQLPWLRQELMTAAQYQHRFVVLSHSLFPSENLDLHDTEYVLEEGISGILQDLFSRYQVTAVFSAGYPAYHETIVQGVHYIVSGGGGGLLLDRQEPYQFLEIDVQPDQVAYKNVAVFDRLGTFSEKLETMKLFLHSFFYMSLFNSLLILSIISLVVLRLYSLILRQEYLYRDFSVDEKVLKKTPLHVAMFTNNYLPFIGGVPLSVDRLYKGLTRKGAKVNIFAPTYLQPWDDPDDGSVFRCPALFHARVDNFPVSNVLSRKTGAAFKVIDCDLVHVHHPFLLGKKGMVLAKRRGIPVVFTYHTRLERYTHYLPFPGKALKNLAAHVLIKRFANHCDAIITPSSSTEEYLRNLGVNAMIETIPTGINIEDYKRWSPQQVQALRNEYTICGEFLLISVSRMAVEKNLDFLIAGLAKVKDLVSKPFKCLLVGDGPERERLQRKVAELGMDEQIIFTGNMAPHEVVRCYLAADLFVFASTSETQGMVLLEAMAGGCPVVAVRASGVCDVVKDGYNGVTVPESTNTWAKAVAGLLSDRTQLSALSENSRGFAENYSVEKITEKILRLYWRVIFLRKSSDE